MAVYGGHVHVGGIVGRVNAGSNEISYCEYYGTIDAEARGTFLGGYNCSVGGIIGHVFGGSIKISYTSSKSNHLNTINANYCREGGIIGWAERGTSTLSYVGYINPSQYHGGKICTQKFCEGDNWNKGSNCHDYSSIDSMPNYRS